jgi:hypothetical protein
MINQIAIALIVVDSFVVVVDFFVVVVVVDTVVVVVRPFRTQAHVTVGTASTGPPRVGLYISMLTTQYQCQLFGLATPVRLWAIAGLEPFSLDNDMSDRDMIGPPRPAHARLVGSTNA